MRSQDGTQGGKIASQAHKLRHKRFYKVARLRGSSQSKGFFAFSQFVFSFWATFPEIRGRPGIFYCFLLQNPPRDRGEPKCALSWHLDFSEALNLQRCLEPARKATFKIFISNWTFHFAQLICQRGRERKIKSSADCEINLLYFLGCKSNKPRLKYFAK